MRPDTADLRQLFLEDVPMMDVRAPVEFGKGAFPGVINLPLMNDRERERVGTAYKQHGQQAAIDLGHQLVSGATKTERIEAWAEFARRHPDGYLYCFRGGLRSQVTQEWLRTEAGIRYPKVIGGYKALRNYLIDYTEDTLASCRLIGLAGMTGTGKTDIIVELEHAIDLEGHACHRGSGFGKRTVPQPSPINFENAIAIDMLKKRARNHRVLVVEDEGRMIGSCALPLTLHQQMQQCPLVWLEDDKASRVARIRRDYVRGLCAEFVELLGPEAGFAAFAERLRNSLDSIAKRLGGERHQRLRALMDQSLAAQEKTGLTEQHEGWIKGLLEEYYDPMYIYQLSLKQERVIFSGNREEVQQYLQHCRGQFD